MRKIYHKEISVKDINKSLETLKRLYVKYNSLAGNVEHPDSATYFSDKCLKIAHVRKILSGLV